jgi:hypothetical protein
MKSHQRKRKKIKANLDQKFEFSFKGENDYTIFKDSLEVWNIV